MKSSWHGSKSTTSRKNPKSPVRETPGSSYGHELLLRVTQGGEFAAEHAPGVQAHGVVNPLWLLCGCVPVQHHCPTPIIICPRVTHGQPELIGVAGGIPV